MNNKYSWNETLKFSWGHIIAFLAIIFISYVCYMGDFYQNGGDFSKSAIKVLIIDLLLIIAFIGAQILKGTDSKFNRCIIIERVLICLSPIIFIWTMIPYNHFWTVHHEKDQIEEQFNTSIEKSKQMFLDYDDYANTRINDFEKTLDLVIQNKENNPETYYKCGFNSNNEEMRKNNLITTLKLQLLSQNTDSLKNVANNWISSANQGATIWNAFLIGNVSQIAEAIETWNKTLIEYSSPVLNEEIANGQKVESFSSDNASIESATKGLTSLKSIYIKPNGIQISSVLTSVLLFMMLLFPYFLQKRSTRATGLYDLLPNVSHKQRKESNDRNNDINEEQYYSNNDDIYGGTF